MVYLGQEMRYVPCYSKGENDGEPEKRAKSVTGTVIYVNREHKYFTVESHCGGVVHRESFKFSQIAKDIHIVRGGKHGK